MSLEEYQKKRTFEETPEPKGEKGQRYGPLRFVVQKHQASRLHYDLRLELNGVLKSWAVPKGPSLEPGTKRLAEMVEDHPIEYADFEGVIPPGNYGAGTVMIWDRGIYHHPAAKNLEEDVKLLNDGLAKGHLSFVLNGEKLKGEFALVKLKKSKDKNSWLLLKAKDEGASSTDILKKDRSVISGENLEGIAESKTKIWESSDGKIDLSNFPMSPMPHHIKPMLATLIDKPFDNAEWLFEVKWDGYRAISFLKDKNVTIRSRNDKILNDKFQTIAGELRKEAKTLVLDGEIVVLDETGKPRFDLIQNYPREGVAVYFVFDIIYFMNRNLTGAPLSLRRKILENTLKKSQIIQISQPVYSEGKNFFEAIKKENLEGMIAKEINSGYEEGERTKKWLKIKTHLVQEAIILGYTIGEGLRQYFGSLILGAYEGDQLIYLGNVGTGFSEKMQREIRRQLDPLIVSKPFLIYPPKIKEAIWVRPVLICEVKFQEWTIDGLMRQPVFLGLRDDIKPENVHRERPGKNKEVSSGKY